MRRHCFSVSAGVLRVRTARNRLVHHQHTHAGSPRHRLTIINHKGKLVRPDEVGERCPGHTANGGLHHEGVGAISQAREPLRARTRRQFSTIEGALKRCTRRCGEYEIGSPVSNRAERLCRHGCHRASSGDRPQPTHRGQILVTALVDVMAAQSNPWPAAQRVDTGQELDNVVTSAVSMIDTTP